MALINLKSYRLAKEFEKDSKDMLKVIDLTQRGLVIFRHYKPIKAILAVLTDQKAILQAHLVTANKILEQKEVEDEK